MGAERGAGENGPDRGERPGANLSHRAEGLPAAAAGADESDSD